MSPSLSFLQRMWRRVPVTCMIVCVQLAGLLLLLLRFGGPFGAGWYVQNALGLQLHPFSFRRFYTLATCCLAPAGFGDILQTGIMIWIAGFVIEPRLGKRRTIQLAVLGVLTLSVTAVLFSRLFERSSNWSGILVGCHGIALAWFGGLLAVWLRDRKRLSRWVTVYVYVVLAGTGLSLLGGLVYPGVLTLLACRGFWDQMIVLAAGFLFVDQPWNRRTTRYIVLKRR